MSTETADLLSRALAGVAPGTTLRDGLDRIVRGGTGALIVLGNPDAVQAISTGGFRLDTELSATSLRELCKMDGAVVVTADLGRIVSAGVHLMPDPSVPTSETGTRHRTADRVARQTGLPVVTVSASMSTIAVFLGGRRHVIQHPDHVLTRANEALTTLARYRDRLTEAGNRLSALEVQDQVTVRDVVVVVQRLAIAETLCRELTRYVTDLGVDGRLVELQLQELALGLDDIARLIGRDYSTDAAPLRLDEIAGLNARELGRLSTIAHAIGLPVGLDQRLTPLGHRQLAQIGTLPPPIADRLLDHFGDLQALLAATPSELGSVEGMSSTVTRSVREALVRLTEAAYAEPM